MRQQLLVPFLIGATAYASPDKQLHTLSGDILNTVENEVANAHNPGVPRSIGATPVVIPRGTKPHVGHDASFSDPDQRSSDLDGNDHRLRLPKPGKPSKQEWPVPPGPVATLQPCVWHDQDTSDFQHLTPTKKNKLYYSENGKAPPNSAYTFASLEGLSDMRVVILDHSKYITNLRCTKNGFSLAFTSRKAFRHAKKYWRDTFIAAMSSLDCDGDPYDPQNLFWLVSSVQFDKEAQIAVLTADEIDINDVFVDVTLSFGRNQPKGYKTSLPGHPKPEGSESETKPYSSSCGEAPAPTIDGWVTADCGPDFDTALDAAIGFLVFDNALYSDSLRDLGPGFSDFLMNSHQDDDVVFTDDTIHLARRRALGHTSAVRDRLHPRSFSIASLFQTLKDKVNDVATTVDDGLKTAGSALAQAGNFVVDKAKGAIDSLTTFYPSKDFNFDLRPNQNQLVDSDWKGPAFELYSAQGQDASVDVYCFSCGISGNVHLEGQIQYLTGAGGLTKGSVSLSGSMDAQLGLGLVAQAQYNNNWSKTIASLPVGAFTIPKLLTIGPVLSLDADLTVDIEAQGRIFFGANASITDYLASIDIVNDANSQANFAPVFNTEFTADGTIDASARLGIPLKVSLEISVPAVSWEKSLSLVNEAYVDGSAEYAISSTAPGLCNNGISYDFQLGDDVYVEVLGSRHDLWTAPNLPSASGCYQLPIGPRQLSNFAPGNDVSSLPSASNNFGGDGILDDSEISKLSDWVMSQSEINEEKPNQYGFKYKKIKDSSNHWYLSANPDGVLELQESGDEDGGLLFGIIDDIACTDPTSRIMFYSPDTMEELGVSRLRLAPQEKIPIGSDLISLKAVDYDDDGATLSVLVGFDSLGQIFYPVSCNIDGYTNKIFLVKDLENGPGLLEEQKLQYIVTGGITTDCTPIALYVEEPQSN